MPKQKKQEKVKSIKISKQDFEKKIIELAKQGLTSEKIGLELAKLGIHPDEHQIKISRILKQQNIYTNPDLKNTETKLEKIKNHFEKNKQDKKAMREKDRVYAKARKLKKYLKIPLK